ncbi:hypothetical protein BDE02_01G228000 [Populus trichocarpa]|nr:hypothetical protein BDE02_01G228000 [Populus trichocarpa]
MMRQDKLLVTQFLKIKGLKRINLVARIAIIRVLSKLILCLGLSPDKAYWCLQDPGHGILKRLIGERHAQDLVRDFLFNGLDELGSKGFLDYFPEYRCEDGSVNEKRSILGKSFENRPWDARGEFIGDDLKLGYIPSSL